MIALYRGEGGAAWRLIDENRRAMRRALLFHTQLLRVEASYLRACCALAAATDDRRHAPTLLVVARDEARRLAGEGMRWSEPLSRLVNAAVAYAEGDTVVAAQRLAGAADGFDLADMKVYAAAARRQLGALLEGERGRELIRQADEAMMTRAVKNPRRLTQMYAPGYPRDAA
jgi:hypothetical protein